MSESDVSMADVQGRESVRTMNGYYIYIYNVKHQNMKRILFIGVALVFTTMSVAKDVKLVDYGVAADGTSLCTDGIQRAIDACAASGGGQVIFQPGRYMSAALELRQGVHLYLPFGAELQASTQYLRDYPHRAFIYAEKAENVGICGQGIINGNGNHPEVLAQGFKVNDGKRPNLLFFRDCRNVCVTDITLCNAGSWTFRLFRVDGATIRGINLRSLAQGNNDGIDVDARDVVISDCHIEAEDDGICLKSDDPNFMPENIVVSNCVIASNCNPIKFGTASKAGFRNVNITNCAIKRTTESNIWNWAKEYPGVGEGTMTGLSGIAIESADGGIIEHFNISGITMEGIITPIFICLNHRNGDTGQIRDISIQNVSAKAEGNIPCLITGSPKTRVHDIVLRDIRVEHEGGEKAMTARLGESNGYPENRMFGKHIPASGLYIRHAEGVIVDNFSAALRKGDGRAALVLDDVRSFTGTAIRSDGHAAQLSMLQGNCSDIRVNAEDLTPLTNTGLDRYDFFYAGERKEHRMYIVRDGNVQWSYYDPEGRGEISDAVLMSDGHILMAHQHGLREIIPDLSTADGYKVVWQMDTPKGFEIHSIQPIGKRKVMYVQCGNPFQAVVMEIPSLREVRRFNLPYCDGGSHGQMRNFRLTSGGTMLLASMQYGAIIEFDSHGTELRRMELPGAWGVEELRDGNILGCSNRGFVREFDKQGKMVWEFDWSDNPDYPNVSGQKAHRLPNGNTMVTNWFNEWSGREPDRYAPPVQAVEVTPEGRVVWELRSWNAPADLGPSTTIQLLDEPVDRKKLHFGDLH